MELLFGELCALSHGQRAARLGAVEDLDVRNEVASLLEHSGEGQTLAAAVGPVATQFPVGEQRFGPYRIVRRLGPEHL